MKKYIAYYRVSTKKQSLGLDAQQVTVNNYIAANDGELVAEFSEKESGKHDHRTELNNAIEECKRTGATLIIAKLDRLSRNITFIFTLRDSGVDFLACDLPQFNTLTLAIFSALAQQERELISQRTKAALAVLRANGVKLGKPNASFTDEMRQRACRSNKAKAEENPNTKRAKIMIEALSAHTRNLTRIAETLNENGFKTALNASFTPTAVKRIIERYGLWKTA